jgi:hypothetical protein
MLDTRRPVPTPVTPAGSGDAVAAWLMELLDRARNAAQPANGSTATIATILN